MKKAIASIEISVVFKCPECGEAVELMDTEHDEKGKYSQMASTWLQNQEISEYIQCGGCKQEFTINELIM